jgi:hypothetical protein
VLLVSALDNTQSPNQTRYQLTSHLQSNTLELDDKAQTLSYEHYYPYGGTVSFIVINQFVVWFLRVDYLMTL